VHKLAINECIAYNVQQGKTHSHTDTMTHRQGCQNSALVIWKFCTRFQADLHTLKL